MNENSARYYEAINLLPQRIRTPLRAIPETLAENIQEVRLRAGGPLSVHNGKEHLFFSAQGLISKNLPGDGFVITKSDLLECFKGMCEYSLHTHQYEVSRGYISLAGGHRAGVSGTVSMANGKTQGLREVSSINLRIAREIKGVATELAKKLFLLGPKSIIIAGPPGSGKTTMLRDMARSLSSGECGEYYKVSVVDERCELAASSSGVSRNDLGPCTDILCGYDKGEGIEIAVRTLSPQFVVCDEIGGESEISAVKSGMFSGAEIITTAHCANALDMQQRPVIKELVATGAFRSVVLLSSGPVPSTVDRVIDAGELS